VTRLLVAGLVAGALCPFAAAANQSFSPVIVTRDSLALNCSPREVAEIVLRLERALDAGDGEALNSVFAKGGFQRFSTGKVTIRDRQRLIQYLLMRHDAGERMRLLETSVANGSPAASVIVGVSVLRVINPPRGSNNEGDVSSQLLEGKARVDCARHRIYSWSVRPGTNAVDCPQMPTANALRTVIACSRVGRKPLAQEVSRDFAVGSAPVRFPRKCRPAAVAIRVVGALRAFDLAGAAAFARNFTRYANMEPYTSTRPPSNLRGRAQIAAFATRRTASGDGWTAARLLPPASVGAGAAIYGLTLRVSSPRGGGENGVKLVIDCRSGLIARWVGPALAEPR
jgi:hypothetical protein